MKTRRYFLKCLSLIPMLASGCVTWAKQTSARWVNDIHSKLNRTRVAQIHKPTTVEALQGIVRSASTSDQKISICGGRHAMGGQQFGTNTQLIDLNGLTRVLNLDTEKGIVEVEAGIQWPELIGRLLDRQKDVPAPWTIAQKQTGADRLTVGGALAANIHSRGLTMQPIISNIESFKIMLASGEIKECSRNENSELFKRAIGGYGLFGIITRIRLRLVRRKKLQRRVQTVQIESMIPAFEDAIAAGARYGDCQFSIDPKNPLFLQEGILSIYYPVDSEEPISQDRQKLGTGMWNRLLLLAHIDKAKAFQLYSDFYRSTDGQIYWSDEHQMNDYSDDYHLEVDEHLSSEHAGSEMITEIYVPRQRLADFMQEAAEDFRTHKVDVIYGTIRLIEKDTESRLPWAKQSYACIIFNLHVTHSKKGIAHSADAFRRLIDLAIKRKGSYYLTYHKWATKDQILTCYPNFPEFLDSKLTYDPDEVFQSDWYRHNKQLLGA
ncbi:FAD-binding oxidoreductase [bacterium]|nr:FAD-binding oxidoreductase [bacterium]